MSSTPTLDVVPEPLSRTVLSPHGSTDTLGEAIAQLAAQLHAATYELLVLLREFDERAGWNCGFLSCAHWLHWRTGIDLGAAREKVRVAKALALLPRVSAAIRRGAISYAKVRAITRVATPQNEASLVDLALCGTAAHVERFVRAWRRVDRVEAGRETEVRHLRRELSIWVDDDGMVVIRGRLTPEIGAVVQRALEAAADRLFRESAGAPSGAAMAEEATCGQRRADALGLLAETALAANLDCGKAGDRYQVVLHVDASADAQAVDVTDGTEAGLFDGTLELADGGTHVSEETSRRIACDAAVVVMHHDASGTVLDVGRKTRTIPSAIRRALHARDTRCQFPGCTARRCDAHHVEHWIDGGVTRLENLVLLCRRHHRAVHEGGFAITRHPNGALAFHGPDGKPLEVAPVLLRLAGEADLRATPVALTIDSLIARVTAGGNPIGARIPAVWDGTPFDVAWAIDVIRGRPEISPI
ncbi:MAG: DUF222 domain-containing protein [Vicinamibacterales bacterium]